jgi:hypothetical protein
MSEKEKLEWMKTLSERVAELSMSIAHERLAGKPSIYQQYIAASHGVRAYAYRLMQEGIILNENQYEPHAGFFRCFMLGYMDELSGILKGATDE